jgi:sugar-specific transcriptional regulator TrmB
MLNNIMFEQELKELGLTDNEVKIYLALLQNSRCSPMRIAKLTGLHRSYVYDAAERLLESGIITLIDVDGKRNYQAADPRTLRESYELKLRSFDSVLPQMTALFASKSEDTEIEMFKGERCYRTLIKAVVADLKKGDTIELIGVDEAFISNLEPIHIKQYFTIIKEKHVKERLIVAKGAKRIDEPGLAYKEVEPSAIGDSVMAIHDNRVYFFIKGSPLYLIAIKSPKFAQSQKKIFEKLWKS